MPRYLHPDTLAVVRQLAEERLPWRRPRNARRVRGFLVGRHRVRARLHQLEAVAA